MKFGNWTLEHFRNDLGCSNENLSHLKISGLFKMEKRVSQQSVKNSKKIVELKGDVTIAAIN